MVDEKPKKPPSPRKKSETPAKEARQAPKKTRDESNPNWWKNEGGGKGEVH